MQPALGFDLLRGLRDISLAQLGLHLVQAYQGEAVSGELTFLQAAELLWAAWPSAPRLGCWVCHLLEVSLAFANGLVVEGEPCEADSPRVHMRPLAHISPLLSATVGQVPAGALSKRVLERE